MSKTLPKNIIKKIQNNIRIIYLNNEIEESAKKIREKIGMPENFFTRFFSENKVGSLKLDDIASIYGLIGYLVGNWAEGSKNTVSEIFDTIYDDLFKSGKFKTLCVKQKINPILWEEVIIARVINMPLDAAILFSHKLASNYLPKITIETMGQINIRINGLTTLEDLKAVWPLVTRAQKKSERNQGFHNVKREFTQLARNKRAAELREKGYTYSQIHKQLLKEGFDSSSYDYVSKMLKSFKKAKGVFKKTNYNSRKNLT